MSESDPKRDPIADEESEAAAAEAARIGGPAPEDTLDPAQRPVVEGGGGEAEGFELAEEELIDHASHGDQRHFPDSDVPPAEEQSDAVYGEADQEIGQDE
ncbi:MAG TPA: hypothetical protein VI039_04445 [Solirubrobacterales bacterium]